MRLPASRRSGARFEWYGELMQTADKPPHRQQAKDADRLGPKGRWSSSQARSSSDTDIAPPREKAAPRRAKRILRYEPARLLTPNLGVPISVPMRESEPQGKPSQMQVGDDGKSECRLVMRWIGVEPQPTSLRAKAGRLPSGLSSRENLINRLRRECR